MGSNYHRRVKFSAFPQASSRPPTLPLPRVPSGSLLLHSGCLPRSSEAIPGLPERRTALAGTWEPRGAQRGGCRKGSCNPGEDAKEGRGRPEGRLPGRGRRIGGGGSATGSWASPPLPAPAADPERLLREIC